MAYPLLMGLTFNVSPGLKIAIINLELIKYTKRGHTMPGTQPVGIPPAGQFTNSVVLSSHGTGFTIFHKNAQNASSLPANPIPYFGSNGSYDTNVVIVKVPKVCTRLELYLLTPGTSAPAGATVLNVYGLVPFAAADVSSNAYPNPGTVSSANFDSILEFPVPLTSTADDSTYAISIANTTAVVQALTAVPTNVTNWQGVSVNANDTVKRYLLSKKQCVNLAGSTSVCVLVSTGSGIANSMIIGRFA